MLAPKIWGTTEDLLDTPLCSVHRLAIYAGGYCSWHHHAAKANVFTVAKGLLTIEVWDDGLDSALAVELKPGDVYSVRAGVKHRFVNYSRSECLALEFYYPEALSEDIVREDIGGVL